MTLPKDVKGITWLRAFPQNECSCERCVNCCKRLPGMFLPGEPEKVAEFLGMPFKEAFDKYMIIDYWFDNRSGQVEYIQPKKLNQIGQSYARFGDPFSGSPCAFLQDGRCIIHSVKPFECRVDIHNDYWDRPADEQSVNHKKSLVWQWKINKVNPWKLIGE